jgi:arylformamidase
VTRAGTAQDDELAARLPDWQSYAQAELDANYDQTTIVPDNGPYKERKRLESAAARSALESELDVPYGAGESERLDVFPAATDGSPVQLFIHGGAWKGGDKSEVSYPALPFHAAGSAFVAVGFDAVPAVTLETQVRQCRDAVKWLYGNAERFGIDRERIHVSGHSSGAHVAAMVAVTDWPRLAGLPADLVKGAAPISGMFDLEPVRHTWRNRYLRLDRARAHALSPIRHIPTTPIPMVVGVGGEELPEFRRQSHEFASAWRAAGQSCEFMIVEGRNHFDLGADLGDPASPVISAILRQMGLGSRNGGPSID